MDIYDAYASVIYFIHNSPEYLTWGDNIETKLLVVTLFLALFEGIGMFQQWIKIIQKPKEQAKSVSSLFMIFETTFLFCFMIYGYHLDSAAMIFSAALPLPFACFSLWAIARLKGVTKNDVIFTLFGSIIVVGLIVAPTKTLQEFFYGTSVFLAIITVADVPFEILKNKDAGRVEVNIYFVYIITSIVWALYGYIALNDTLLVVTELISIVLFAFTIFIYFKYNGKFKFIALDR